MKSNEERTKKRNKKEKIYYLKIENKIKYDYIIEMYINKYFFQGIK